MPPETAATDPTLHASRPGDGGLLLTLAGRLEVTRLADLWPRASRIVQRARAPKVTVDAAEVTYCDAAGASMLRTLRELQAARGGALEIVNFPEEYAPILDLLDRGQPAEPPPPPQSRGWVEFVGRATVYELRDIGSLIGAVGEIVIALVKSLRHPRRIRWADTIRAAQIAGVNSLPIVALVSGLLGLIFGFQSAQTLHDYGGDMLLAHLLGISFFRELGPLMTAIVLTARSGSAFAAEIGTMTVNEEVSALRTIGVDPVRFLVVPRVIAAVVMTPVLTVFANLFGMLGGLVVWTLTLDYSFAAYLSAIETAVKQKDLWTGLAKSVVFGTLVAGVGCIRGMQTQGSASAVGNSTTSAVVSGIVLIALGDAAFTVLFHFMDL